MTSHAYLAVCHGFWGAFYVSFCLWLLRKVFFLFEKRETPFLNHLVFVTWLFFMWRVLLSLQIPCCCCFELVVLELLSTLLRKVIVFEIWYFLRLISLFYVIWSVFEVFLKRVPISSFGSMKSVQVWRNNRHWLVDWFTWLYGYSCDRMTIWPSCQRRCDLLLGQQTSCLDYVVYFPVGKYGFIGNKRNGTELKFG